MRWFVLWLVAFALNLQMLGASYAAQTYQVPDETKAIAARYAKGFTAARDSIDLKYFDVDARSEALDYDVDTAADFVVNAIAYDPYVGVLRGPEGTLSAQAGSAWDQAVTLSALINAMGGESMIAQGPLSKADAARLIAQHFAPRQALDVGITAESLAKAMQAHVPQAALDSARQRTTQTFSEKDGTNTAVQAGTQSLLQTLASAGKPLAETASAEAFVQQIAQDYAWVQYRDTPNDPWKTVHPAFGSADAPTVEVARYVADTVPADKLHKVKVELEIERFESGKIQRIAIITPYERPAANQAGQQISLAIGPNDQTSGPDGEAGFFVPLMNGALPEGAQAFTLLGLTAPAEDALGGPTIFATVADRFGGALGALDERKDGETPAIGLAGVVLKISHTAPGATPVIAERRLSDFRPDAPQGLGSMSADVVFDGVIDVSVGPENKARDLRNLFAANAARAQQLPLFLAVSTGAMSVEDYIAQDIELVTDQSWADMTLYGEAFAPKRTQTQSVVRQGPLVTMHRLQQLGGEKGQLQSVIDIMHHSSLGIRQAGGALSLAPRAALEQGVRESVMEGAMIGKSPEQSWVTASLGDVIADQAALEAFIAKGGMTQSMAARLSADLAHAGLLIISKADGPLHWWRVSAQTGQTLGMSYHGGAEVSEYAQLVTGVAGLLIAGVFAIKGAVACNDTYADDPGMLACCQAGNALMFLGGVAAGAAAGGALATSSLAEAWMAGLGYFTAMMTWEFTVDVTAATVGGAIADAACSALLK